MNHFRIRLVILMSGLMLCCSWLAAEPIETTYLYKGFDSNGVLAVEGVLNLGISTNHVNGNWKLERVKRSEVKNLGPQIGSGKLTGDIAAGKINLNLNPGWADNNVMLSGTLAKTNISGKWGYYGFAGQMAGGKFEAVKQPANPTR
jgi:hypothetical protein